MKVAIINGKPLSGKDTFVKMCENIYPVILNVSTVDFVKEVATFCGWDGKKTPINRIFLAKLKDLLTWWNDVPATKVDEAIRRFRKRMEEYDYSDDELVVFIHCREPKEIIKLVEKYNGRSLLIRRGAVENAEASNEADENVFNFEYDDVVDNNGTLDELQDKAREYLLSLGVKI